MHNIILLATIGVIARLLSRQANHSEADLDLMPDHVSGRTSSHKHPYTRCSACVMKLPQQRPPPSPGAGCSSI